jgi:alkaline phosphatase D
MKTMNPLDLPLKVLRKMPNPLSLPMALPAALKDFSDDLRARVESATGPAPATVPTVRTAVQPQVDYVDDTQVSGIQIGEVSAGIGGTDAIVWARLPYPAAVDVAWSTDGPDGPWHHLRAPHALEVTDFTTRVPLRGLPCDALVHLRVTATGLEAAHAAPWIRRSQFRTAPAAATPRSIRFAWSADVNGQGFGINPDFGGLRIFDVLRGRDLDFFVHLGDAVYADAPLQPVIEDERGRGWRNVMTQAKTKVAESLAEYRANFRYNWLDAAYTRFCAEVPQIVIWDDHEVVNNWSPSLNLQRDKRYTVKDLPLLAATAARAFREHMPIPLEGFDGAGRLYRVVHYGPLLDIFVVDMQTHRGPNSHNLQTEASGETGFLGAEQVAWLQQALLESKAVWKVIAAGMPVGINVSDGHDAEGRVKWQGVANGDDGPPKGRELELASLLSFMKAHGIHNTVWLCADVHYTAAHYFDPEKAAFKDFAPFWEFISGPLNAGSYGPFNPDGTFGTQVRYSRASPVRGASPAAGYQFFGEVEIDAATRAMHVKLCDISGTVLHTEVLVPR